MGIYKKANSNNFMMSKTVNGLTYFKSSGTNLKMEARANFDRWVIELKEQIRTGEPVKQKQEPIINNSTFSELADKYLEWCDGRQKSYDVKKYVINKLNIYFTKETITGFTVESVENMQSDMLKKGYKPAYVNKVLNVLKHIFRKAFEWELIDENMLKKIRTVKQIKGETKRLRYLSDDEIQRLLSHCSGYLKFIVITALNTGMRKEEILKLTWDRIDLKNRLILLDRTKNGERREIPINDTLYKVLSAMVRNIKTDYVFYNTTTLKPFNSIKTSFGTALRKAHIIDFHFHDLRHTFASRLVMGGVDLTTVKELLGHKSITMTLRYSHLASAHIQNAVKVLDNKDFEKNFTDSLPQQDFIKNNIL